MTIWLAVLQYRFEYSFCS